MTKILPLVWLALAPWWLATPAWAELPQCSYEDCSDQPGQIGIWTDPDTGNRWESHGEYSTEVSE